MRVFFLKNTSSVGTRRRHRVEIWFFENKTRNFDFEYYFFYSDQNASKPGLKRISFECFENLVAGQGSCKFIEIFDQRYQWFIIFEKKNYKTSVKINEIYEKLRNFDVEKGLPFDYCLNFFWIYLILFFSHY